MAVSRRSGTVEEVIHSPEEPCSVSGLEFESLPFIAVFIQFVPQRAVADTEDFRGVRTISTRSFQGFENKFLFRFPHGHAHFDFHRFRIGFIFRYGH